MEENQKPPRVRVWGPRAGQVEGDDEVRPGTDAVVHLPPPPHEILARMNPRSPSRRVGAAPKKVAMREMVTAKHLKEGAVVEEIPEEALLAALVPGPQIPEDAAPPITPET